LRDVDFVPELLSEDLFDELELDELLELVTVALELEVLDFRVVDLVPESFDCLLEIELEFEFVAVLTDGLLLVFVVVAVPPVFILGAGGGSLALVPLNLLSLSFVLLLLFSFEYVLDEPLFQPYQSFQ
jgi:hypothetical protein